MFTCVRCDMSKPVTEFYASKAKRGHQSTCKDCRRAEQSDWRKANPDGYSEWYESNKEHKLSYNREWVSSNRDRIKPTRTPEQAYLYHILRTYGVTEAQYEQMRSDQSGACAICGCVPTGRRLYVDHCHDTGRVRGLLCPSCNRGLGAFRDDRAALLKAADYLAQGGQPV